MSLTVLSEHLAFAAGLLIISAIVTSVMRRAGIFDIPNARSSHDFPVPSGGGVAIVTTALIGFLAIYLVSDRSQIPERHMIGVAIAAVAIAVIGLLDDLGRLGGFKKKLCGQVLAAAVLLAFGIVVDRITVPFYGSVTMGWFGYPVTLVWVVALTNVVNFMDGLDGMAAGTAVIAAASLSLITFMQGSHFVYMLSYALMAASLGFLVFNFPRARIFMGDVGSQFLGFVFAALGIMAAELDASNTSILVVPLLFLHFVLDTGFTFCRRLISGEYVTRAHRSHLYQLLNRLGQPHARISVLYFTFAAVQGAAAVILEFLPDTKQMLVFVPFLVFWAGYTWWVVQVARRARLI